MIEHNVASTREEAVEKMNVLLGEGIISHITKDHPFKDDLLYYCFLDWNPDGSDEEPNKDKTSKSRDKKEEKERTSTRSKSKSLKAKDREKIKDQLRRERRPTVDLASAPTKKEPELSTSAPAALAPLHPKLTEQPPTLLSRPERRLSIAHASEASARLSDKPLVEMDVVRDAATMYSTYWRNLN